jgi:hypothetical protein
LHKPAPPVVAKSVKIERPPAVAQSPQQTITHAVTPQQMASQPLPQLRMPEPQYIEPIQFPDTPLHVGHYINEEPAQRLAEQQPPPNYGSYSNTTTPPQKEQQPAGGIIGMPIGNGQQLQQGQAGGMPNAGPMGPFGGAPFMPMMRR